MKHELYHLIVALVLSAGLYVSFGSLAVSAICLVVSMLLDGDHMVDYMLYLVVHRRSFSLKEFLAGSYFPVWQKFITPLHSWELAGGSIILAYLWGNPYLLAFGVALASHYFVDYATNDVNKKAYFFLFRVANGFRKAAIRR